MFRVQDPSCESYRFEGNSIFAYCTIEGNVKDFLTPGRVDYYSIAMPRKPSQCAKRVFYVTNVSNLL